MKVKHTLMNDLRLLLGKEIKLEAMTLENGTTIEAEAFEPGYAVFVMMDGEKVPLPAGDYALDNGEMLKVDDQGVILSVGQAEEVEPEQEQEMEEAANPKKVVEQVVKETHFEKEEKEEVVEVLFTDAHKVAMKEIFMEFYNELNAQETETVEETEEAKEPVQEELSAVEKIKHSPEKGRKKVDFSTMTPLEKYRHLKHA